MGVDCYDLPVDFTLFVIWLGCYAFVDCCFYFFLWAFLAVALGCMLLFCVFLMMVFPRYGLRYKDACALLLWFRRVVWACMIVFVVSYVFLFVL